MTVCPGNIEEEVLRVLSPETSMSMSARQAWLLVLGNMFPREALKVLESQMDFDTGNFKRYCTLVQKSYCYTPGICVGFPHVCVKCRANVDIYNGINFRVNPR